MNETIQEHEWAAALADAALEVQEEARRNVGRPRKARGLKGLGVRVRANARHLLPRLVEHGRRLVAYELRHRVRRVEQEGRAGGRLARGPARDLHALGEDAPVDCHDGQLAQRDGVAELAGTAAARRELRPGDALVLEGHARRAQRDADGEPPRGEVEVGELDGVLGRHSAPTMEVPGASGRQCVFKRNETTKRD